MSTATTYQLGKTWHCRTAARCGQGRAMAGILQLAAEGLVQQGFFQGVEGGQFLLVEGFEALGLFGRISDICNDTSLL